ncbi:MAG TPA: zinc ribbon domain-containing protein [Pyrinomonadaceae bacterium]|jgi:hypothetical protein|nr:zinc ribbon domain-containing protein [Pyrinomonadaceae bacterium]
MTSTCRQCGTELLPQTSFCRQCGTAITPSGGLQGDERTTALFDEADIVATQRLDPRPTSPDRAHLNLPTPAVAELPKKSTTKVVLLSSLFVVVLIVVVCTIALVRTRSGRIASGDGLVYPGSRKLVDMVAEGGGRAIQLETSDSFESVDEWYRKAMKPQKVVQLTSASVVLKNDKTTATIVTENNKTNILLKIVP